MILCLMLFMACTSCNSPDPSSSKAPLVTASGAARARPPAKKPPAAPAKTTGALELHVKGPAVVAKPGVQRPKGCSDTPEVVAAPAGPVADAVAWSDVGPSSPRSEQVVWSGCQPSTRTLALTPRSAISVRNADSSPLELGITPWPGTVPPMTWRTLPRGATVGVAFPKEPGLYLLIDKHHDWARVLVAIGAVSAVADATGVARLTGVPAGEVHVHVAHPDTDRVTDLSPTVSLGVTTLDVELGATPAPAPPTPPTP